MDFFKKMFSTNKKIYIGFEDVKYAILHRDTYIIINVLSAIDQDCLIFGTIPSTSEEMVINSLINTCQMKKTMVLYGRNSADESVAKKRTQLMQLGFETIYIYGGGLFEWFLLQDVFGFSEFPTTAKCRDFLKFRAPCSIHPVATITY